VENVLGRCSASNMAVPSHDQVHSALSSCNGDEEEAVASLVTSSFLRNIYAGYSNNDRTLQLRSAWLNEEMSPLLKDDTLPRDVSCYRRMMIFHNSLCCNGNMKALCVVINQDMAGRCGRFCCKCKDYSNMS